MKANVFLFAMILFILTVSCNKSKNCSGVSENKGIIVNSVIVGSCFADFEDKTFVINSQAKLDSFYLISEQNGHTCSKPEIDFAQYTLLVQYASGQCEMDITREVIKDTSQQQYVYTVEVKECGSCENLIFSLNGVLTPKLPSDWTVRFILK